MREIMDEYGGSILGAICGSIIIGFISYAFMDANGLISILFNGLISLYL